MKVKEQLNDVVGLLEELSKDGGVPKNIKIKIDEVISILNENIEASIQVNKSLHLLEDVANDPNLKSYTRTQIWNVISVLEKI